MSEKSERSDLLTVLIFKDQLAARTFRVPLGWISRAGFLLATVLLVGAVTTILAVKFYRDAARMDPTRVIDLERRLAEAENSYQALQERLQAVNEAAPETAEASKPTPAEEAAASNEDLAEGGAQIGEPVETSRALVFRALPDTVQPPSALAKPTVGLNDLRLNWKGSTLYVRFRINNLREDGATQSGRLIILARGPESLLAYPTGALNGADSESLVNTAKGEYFSMSRFRTTNADFGPVRTRDGIKELQVLIVGTSNELLLTESIKVPPAPAPAPRTRPRARTRARRSSAPASPAAPTPAPAEAPAADPAAVSPAPAAGKE